MSKVLVQGEWVEGFSTGKKLRILDWQFRKEQRDFEKLVAILRAAKWSRAHPDARKRIVARYNATEKAKGEQRRATKKWRASAKGKAARREESRRRKARLRMQRVVAEAA